jgi:precorrin-2 dehydrogenase / sirohydrochlorin ferrochelatase
MPSGAKSDIPFFPLMLDLRGRKCLVVGAGKIAAGKIDGLLNHGAKIMVVSPRAVRGIQAKARSGKLVWRQRVFSSQDVKGAFLVIAATNSSEVNGTVFRACSAHRVLCNSVDDPDHCDFFYPAVVRRGPLQIAISTNGNLPALAARLRKELDAQFGQEWGARVKQLGRLRREIRNQEPSLEKRRQRLLRLATPKAFSAFFEKNAGQRSGKRRPSKKLKR